MKTWWNYIEIPVYAIIIWSALSVVMMGYSIGPNWLIGIFGWVVTLGAYGYIGHTAKKDKKKTGEAAKMGAFAGLIVGAASGVISIASMYLFPQIYEEAIQQAVAVGASREFIMLVMKISSFVMSIIIQTIIGTITAAVATKISK